MSYKIIHYRIALPEDVVVEEVQVQASLHYSAGIHYVIVLIVWLVVSAVHPVGNVKSSVCTKKKHIVRREIFNLSIPLKDD